jgi:hypothetical protein
VLIHVVPRENIAAPIWGRSSDVKGMNSVAICVHLDVASLVFSVLYSLY